MTRTSARLKTILMVLPPLCVGTPGCGGEDRTIVLLPDEVDGVAGAGEETPPVREASDDFAPAQPDAGPPPEPFSMPFEGMFGQEVQWSDLRVSVTGARVERGMDAPEAGDPWGAIYDYPQPEDVYAELDVQIENGGSNIRDYTLRNTWDLILADGSRVQPANSLGVMISPGDTATTTLRYLVDDVVDLAGAALELNGDERGKLEPERIPLDAAYVRQYPLRLTEAVGKAFLPSMPGAGAFAIEVIDAAYDANDPELGRRAAAGHRFVRIEVIGTYMGNFSDTLDERNFYLVVDGHSYAIHAMSETDLVNPGVSQRVFVDFLAEASVRRFELSFVTRRDDPQHRIAVDLDNAVIAEP